MKRLTNKELFKKCSEVKDGGYLADYHIRLYSLIKLCTEMGVPCSVEYICSCMPDTYHLNKKECNYSNCPALYWDIDWINNSEYPERIIIKQNGNFRLGTREESIDYANKLKQRAIKRLAQYGAVTRKLKLENQLKLECCGNAYDI